MRHKKFVDFETVFWEKVHRIFVAITPPIVIAFIWRIRDQLQRRALLSDIMPAPPKYSTLDNPLEVPSQVECYLFCRDKYLKPTDTVLDVGFGLGYGLQIMAAKVANLTGIEVDTRAVERASRIFEGHPSIRVMAYPNNGQRLPFDNKSFDVVTCVEVIEHVEDYKGLLLEMTRVARRLVFITTPNRRLENTLPNGRPKNYWHLREWTKTELDLIFAELGLDCEWNFLSGPYEGPFTWTKSVDGNTRSLVPVIRLTPSS